MWGFIEENLLIQDYVAPIQNTNGEFTELLTLQLKENFPFPVFDLILSQ